MSGRIKAAMESLGLYHMKEGGLAAGEIAAYEQAVFFMEQTLQTMLKEILFMSAQGYGLEYWEDTLGLRGSGSTTQRRLRIMEKLCRSPGRFDGAEFLYRLQKINADVWLETEGKTLLVHEANRADLEQLGQLAGLLVQELAPTVKIALDGTGKAWADWDKYYKNWNYYDRIGLPWAFFDTV